MVHKEKYICKNLRVKEGGGCFIKGGIFSGTYGICIYIYMRSLDQAEVNADLIFECNS